jgi:hypothetical protein
MLGSKILSRILSRPLTLEDALLPTQGTAELLAELRRTNAHAPGRICMSCGQRSQRAEVDDGDHWRCACGAEYHLIA